MSKPTNERPHLILEGGEEQAPSLDLRKQLPRRHPELFRRNPGPTYATVRVVPRCKMQHMGDCGRHVREGAWYDVFYSYEAMETASFYECGTLDGENRLPKYRNIGKPIAQLPRPIRKTFEQRWTELPPIVVTDQDVQFFGSEEEARKDREAMRKTAIEQDHSNDAYDWEATADAYARILEPIRAIKLTKRQRAEHADVHVYRLETGLPDARTSRTALRRNAGLEPLPEDLHGNPGQLVWIAVQGESPQTRAFEPGAIGADVPEYILAWAQAREEAFERGDTDFHLLVTDAEEEPNAPVQGEVARVTAPATAEQMYPVRKELARTAYLR